MKKKILLLNLFFFSISVGAQTVLDSSFLFTSAPFASCHAATIAETPSGNLVVAYFGGSWEGASDVCIWMSRRMNGDRYWQSPVVVARGDVGDTTPHPCWNPVLFQLPGSQQPLMLFYKTGRLIKDWVGHSQLSFDDGEHWSASTAFPSEFMLGPIKNKPIYHDGRVVCPSSWENGNIWHTRFEYFDWPAKGFRWNASSPDTPDSIRSIQPTILVHKDGTLQALCRTKEGVLSVTYSRDNGATWSPEVLTDIPNPNSGIDAVTLRNGCFAMVYNPVALTSGGEAGPRTPLVLAVSKDGLRWTQVLTLESEVGEYSYPSIIEARDHTLHVVYTWNRLRIKHVHIKLDM